MQYQCIQILTANNLYIVIYTEKKTYLFNVHVIQCFQGQESLQSTDQ